MITLLLLCTPQDIIMITCSTPGDDKVGVMATLVYQCIDTLNFDQCTIYDNLLSNIFHCSEPFVKMWYESILHTCYQTKLNNILVNDCNIYNHFAGYHIFMLRHCFSNQVITNNKVGNTCCFRVWTGFYNRDDNVHDEKQHFLVFCRHMITRISILWIYDCSGSGINQCHVQHIEAETRCPPFCTSFSNLFLNKCINYYVIT